MPPRHLTSEINRLREGQTWRDATTPGSTVANVITVESIDSAGTVQGTYRPENTVAIGTGAWSLVDFERFVLVSDPDWTAFEVVASLGFDDPRAQRVTRSVGVWVGSRSHTVRAGGLGGPATCWSVVAPTLDEAIELVRAAVGDPTVQPRHTPNWQREN
jgi:hypothetical protein